MKTLVYGVGNPYRCDDRIGLEIAEMLQSQIKSKTVVIRTGSLDGLAMLDEITDFEKVIFVDSIKTKNGKPGDIYRIILDPQDENLHLSVTHGLDFVGALRTGSKLGYRMPKVIIIYAVEIEDNESYREECTEYVKASVPEATARIIEEINTLSMP